MKHALVGVTGFLCLLFSFGARGAATGGKPPAEKVDRIVVEKNAHTIALFSGEKEVYRTTVAIGPGGAGPKLQEGDRVTPVGRYRIVSKGPSRFHIFMGIDYPNAEDRARFAKLKAEGVLPKTARIGGDVGIHGPLPAFALMHKTVDWTLGCVAVDTSEIEEIAARTPIGTVVEIKD